MTLPSDDPGIERVLRQAAETVARCSPSNSEEIASMLLASHQKARRSLASRRSQIGALVLGIGAVSSLCAANAGFEGLAALGIWRSAALLTLTTILSVAAAGYVLKRFSPGSLLRLEFSTQLSLVCAVLVAGFLLLLKATPSGPFVAQGIGCLKAGLIHSIPAALIATLVLRGGFAVRPVLAAAAIGVFSAFAGVDFLEMHCENLSLWHQLVWHTAVIPFSAAALALLMVIYRFAARWSRDIAASRSVD
jgi:negative regulator of sigma F NrsF-like protein